MTQSQSARAVSVFSGTRQERALVECREVIQQSLEQTSKTMMSALDKLFLEITEGNEVLDLKQEILDLRSTLDAVQQELPDLSDISLAVENAEEGLMVARVDVENVNQLIESISERIQEELL